MRITVGELKKLIREAMASDPDIVRVGDAMVRASDDKVFKVVDYVSGVASLVSADGDADEVMPGRGTSDWVGDEGNYTHQEYSDIELETIPPQPRTGAIPDEAKKHFGAVTHDVDPKDIAAKDDATVPPPRRQRAA